MLQVVNGLMWRKLVSPFHNGFPHREPLDSGNFSAAKEILFPILSKSLYNGQLTFLDEFILQLYVISEKWSKH